MKLIRDQIRKNINRKGLCKIIGVFLIVGIFASSHVFAQEQTTGQSGWEFLNVSMNTILSLLSRLWIFLATLAGKLMTNDWVYGSIFHMDMYLWKIWNVMKNIANFALAGLILVEVFKMAIGKSNGFAKVLKNSLIAAVLIQASRFAIGSVIDISNVAVSAVGSFPSVLMSDNKEVASGLQTFANNFHQLSYEIDFEKDEVVRKKDPAGEITPIQKDSFIQSILPNANSVSGPLIFIGASIFRFHEFTDTSELKNVNRKTISLSIALKLLVIVFFTLALLFLVVANIIRIGFLWMFIVLAPVIVLYIAFDKKGKESVFKYFDLKSILWTVFKPTIFVGYVSLMLVVLVLIRSFFVINPNTEIGGMSISATPDSTKMSIEGINNTEIKGNILKDSLSQGQSIFSDLLVFLLGLFLMRKLVTLAISTDKGPIGETMKSIGFDEELLSGAMKNIPIAGGYGIGAIRSTMTKQTKKILDEGLHIRWDGKGDFNANFDEKGSALLEEKISSLVGDKIGWNDNTHGRALTKILDGGGAGFREKSHEIAKKIQGGLSINNPDWMGYVKKWIDQQTIQLGYRGGFKGTLASTSAEDMKKFFEEKQNRDRFHELMAPIGFKFSDKINRTQIQKYEDLQKAMYGNVETE